MARRPHPAVAAALLVGVATGCSDDNASLEPSASTSPPTTIQVIELPDQVEVAVEFPRYLQVDRAELEVVVDNGGDTDIEVTGLALRSPLFEPGAVSTERTTTVRVGRRVDIQVGLGPSVCPAPAGPSHVELSAVVGGVRQHGLVAVDAAPLERISATDCGRELVRQQVDVGFAPDFVVDDGVVHTELALARRQGDEAIEVEAVRGSVLLELRADEAMAPPLATLAAGEDNAGVPVQLRVVRCDPHAVIESKKTFQLSTWIALGSADPQHLLIVPEGDLRAALQELIQDCLRAESGG